MWLYRQQFHFHSCNNAIQINFAYLFLSQNQTGHKSRNEHTKQTVNYEKYKQGFKIKSICCFEIMT
jgi:plasmid replication initiation protein